MGHQQSATGGIAEADDLSRTQLADRPLTGEQEVTGAEHGLHAPALLDEGAVARGVAGHDQHGTDDRQHHDDREQTTARGRGGRPPGHVLRASQVNLDSAVAPCWEFGAAGSSVTTTR